MFSSGAGGGGGWQGKLHVCVLAVCMLGTVQSSDGRMQVVGVGTA